MPVQSGHEGSTLRVDDVASNIYQALLSLADITRHVIGCDSTLRKPGVKLLVVDVASNICPALHDGAGRVLRRLQGRGGVQNEHSTAIAAWRTLSLIAHTDARTLFLVDYSDRPTSIQPCRNFSLSLIQRRSYACSHRHSREVLSRNVKDENLESWFHHISVVWCYRLTPGSPQLTWVDPG